MKDFWKRLKGRFGMSTDKHTFSPGQLVLVRGGGSKAIDPRVWRVDMFSFQREETSGVTYFFTGTGVYRECIPFEGHEFLVGSARPSDSTPPKGHHAAEGPSDVATAAAIAKEVEGLRVKLRERDSRIEELKADVCKVTAERSVLLERYRDSASSRRGLEDNIVALLTHKDPSAGAFLQRVVAENRVHREEREKLLEERDKLLTTIEELRTGMRQIDPQVTSNLPAS